MSNTVQTLMEFIEMAEKNRKYAKNTVYGLKAALRLFEPELKNEEKESLETFKDRFEQIYQSVFTKNKAKMAASSLEVYRRRLLGLIADYEKYGTDPTKMVSWVRPSRKTSTRKIEDDNKREEQQVVIEKGPGMDRFELSLRPNVKAIIVVPFDLSADEAKKIKRLVDYLTSEVK